MTNQIKVSEIMTKSVIVAHSENTFEQVMTFFKEVGVHHLPVTEGGKLVGLISVKDLANFLFELAKEGKTDQASVNAAFKVTSVMTPNLITVSPDDLVTKAVDILSNADFQSLPVVSDGSLVGILTNKDIVKMLHWDYTHQHGSNFTSL